MGLENNASEAKPKLSLHRAKKPVRTKKAATTQRRRRSSPNNHLAKLPIPSFQRGDELENLQQKYLKEFGDSSDDDSKPTKRKSVPSRNKAPVPSFAATTCLDSDTDEDDDLLTLPVFSKPKAVVPELKKKASASTAATLNPATAKNCSSDSETETEIESEQQDAAAAPWSAESKSKPVQDFEARMLQCADHYFGLADLETVTLKGILSQVERELEVTLEPERRTIVRERVLALIDSPKKAAKSSKQPTRQVLEPAVVAVLGQFDCDSCTLKEVIVALEKRFGVTFSKQTRAVAKKCLIEVMNRQNVSSPNAKTDQGQLAVRNTAVVAEPAAKLSVDGENKQRLKSVVDCVEWATERSRPLDQVAYSTTAVQPSNAPKETTRSVATLRSVPVAETVKVAPKAKAPERKKRGRSRQAKQESVAAPSNNATIAPPAKASRKAAPARSRKRARGSCQLCSNCPCQHETAELNAFDALDTVQSDAAHEKMLIKLLQKLERVTERHENQTDGVRRKLKKHRRDLWRKHQALCEGDRANRLKESRFLPAVNELAKRLDDSATAQLSTTAVRKAQTKMFPLAKDFQPTLTQMFGGEKRSDDDGATRLEVIDENAMEANGAESGSESIVDLEAGASDGESVVQAAKSPSGPESEQDDDAESAGVEADVHRVEWKNDDGDNTAASPVAAGLSVWRSLMTGALDCAWDRLFDDDEEDGIDHLLGMLDEPEVADEAAFRASPTQAASPVGISQLSQRGRHLAEDIIDRISSDTDNLSALEASCPNWRENICFALQQQETGSVHEALENLRQSKAKVLRVKERVVAAAEQQEMVFSLFEDALQSSLSRFQEPSGAENEGFFPTQVGSPARPSARDDDTSIAGVPHETTPGDQVFSVETIIASASSVPDHWTSERFPASALDQESNGNATFSPSTPTPCARLSVLKTPESETSKATIIASMAS